MRHGVMAAGDRQQLFQVLSGQQQLPSKALSLDSSSSSSDDSAAAASAAARQAWEDASRKMQASGVSAGSSAEWLAGGGVSYDEAEQTWQQLLHLAGQPDGPRFDQVLAAGSSSSDGLQQQLQKLHAALQRSLGLDQQQVQDLAGVGSSSSGDLQPADLHQQLQDVFVAPPTLDQVLQQRLAEVRTRAWLRCAQVHCCCSAPGVCCCCIPCVLLLHAMCTAGVLHAHWWCISRRTIVCWSELLLGTAAQGVLLHGNACSSLCLGQGQQGRWSDPDRSSRCI